MKEDVFVRRSLKDYRNVSNRSNGTWEREKEQLRTQFLPRGRVRVHRSSQARPRHQ